MALTEEQIKIIIAAELKEKGFKDASKATSHLEKQFKSFGKTLLAAFSVRGILNFGKASIQAFAQAEREATQLKTQLKGLNLEFASSSINRFMDNLSLATGRSGQELTNAFVKLSQATNDITTAQKLLRTAMDISAASGEDLGTVSVALQRAYQGEVSAIAKLKIGFTATQLKGKTFNQVMQQLEQRFSGAQAAAAETYAGKMARLAEATDMAKEAFGKALVQGIEETDVGLKDLQTTIISVGDAFGYATGRAIGFINSVYQDVGKALLEDNDPVSKLVRKIAGIGDIRRAADVAGRADLRMKNAILKQEKKNQLERSKNLQTETKAQKDNIALKRAGTIFDMENIQIVAALQGRINEEQRIRLVTLLAINNENADAAEKLSQLVMAFQKPALENLGITLTTADNASTIVAKIINAQTQLALVNLGLQKVVNVTNPFKDWDDTMKELLRNIDDLIAKLKLVKPPGWNFDLTKPPTVVPQPKDVPPIVVAPKPVFPFPGANARGEYAGENIFPGGDGGNYLPGTVTAIPGLGGVSRGEYSSIISTAASAMMGSYGRGEYSGSNPFYAYGMGGSSRGEYGAINVTVNVSGSVTTENDLVATITDQLYEFQQRGGNITLSSVSI